jgi:hypothetical protein
MIVIDTSSNVSSSLALLKAKGVAFVGRYYSSSAGKRLTQAEAKLIDAAGIQMFTVFEDDGDPELTADMGLNHAQIALVQAAAVGQPHGSAIYFGLEHLPNGYTSQHLGGIKAYVSGLKEGLGELYKLGVYSDGVVCAALLDAGMCDFTWLSASRGFPGSKDFYASRRWVLAQDPDIDQDWGGLSVDLDEAAPNFGAFRLSAAGDSPASGATSRAMPRREAPFVAAELTFPGNIKVGDNGMPVRRVQEWLAFHKVAPGGVDGDYGPLTAHAVSVFQKSQSLSESGLVDQPTWSALTFPLRQVDSFISSDSNPRAAVVATAQAHLAQGPIEIGGENRGPWVRYYCHGHDGEEWEWCQGFASSVFQQAFDNLHTQAPFLTTIMDNGTPVWCLYVPTFVDHVRMQGGFVSGSDPALKQKLHQGAFFFVRSSKVVYQHVGLIESIDLNSGTFSSIEGNTNDDGSANGYKVARRVRSIGSAYDFGVFGIG